MTHVIQPSHQTVITSQVTEWIVPKAEETYLRLANSGSKGTYLEDLYQRLKDVDGAGKLVLDFYGTTHPHALNTALKSLQNLDVLKELSLTSCRLGLEKALFQSLCELLPSCKNMTKIDLSNNGMTKTHIRDLTLAFIKCPSLTSLKLSFNTLDDSISDSIGTILETCANLSHLYLSSCLLTKRFTDNLNHHHLNRLTLLDLSYNRLGIHGMGTTLKGLQNSASIKNLLLDGCAKQFKEGDLQKCRDCISDFIEKTRSLNLEEISITNNKGLGSMFPDLCPYIKTK